MPKFSIILPCYNVEKYIAKSIQSVLNQTFVDFELLVIIDGSPDRSKAVAEKFLDERITIYEKPNGGLSDARNFGLERANGEFVYFMDSDDWIEHDLAEKTLAVLEEEKLDIVIFGYFQDDEDFSSNLIKTTEFLPNVSCFDRHNSDIVLTPYMLGILGYAWNKVYRRSFLVDNNLLFEKGTSLVEDILFNSQAYQLVDRLYFLNEGFYHYMNRPVSTLMKKFHGNSFELKTRKTRYLEIFFKTWNIKDYNILLAFSQVQGIRYCIHNLFSFQNELSFTEKVNYVKTMVDDEYTQSVIKYYIPRNKIDKILKSMISNRNHYLIAILAFIKK